MKRNTEGNRSSGEKDNRNRKRSERKKKKRKSFVFCVLRFVFWGSCLWCVVGEEGIVPACLFVSMCSCASVRVCVLICFGVADLTVFLFFCFLWLCRFLRVGSKACFCSASFGRLGPAQITRAGPSLTNLCASSTSTRFVQSGFALCRDA